jgi:hypothetical protein
MQANKPLDPEFLGELARIGRAETFEEIGTLFSSTAELENAGAMVRRHYREWLAATQSWSGEDIAGLIKSLVYAEDTFDDWGAGSAQPAIFLFRHLTALWPWERQDALADWILAHTTNDHLLRLGASGRALTG